MQVFLLFSLCFMKLKWQVIVYMQQVELWTRPLTWGPVCPWCATLPSPGAPAPPCPSTPGPAPPPPPPPGPGYPAPRTPGHRSNHRQSSSGLPLRGKWKLWTSVADTWHFGTDPDLTKMSPDPRIRVSDKWIQIRNMLFSAYYFLRVHLHHFSKIKIIKKSQNSTIGIKTFLTIFAWW